MDEESKKYEISLMLKSEETAESVILLVKKYGGEVLETNPLQKIKLSYQIKKETNAFFLSMIVRLTPDKISALDQSLRLAPETMRFLIITPPIEKEERRDERLERSPRPYKPELSKKMEELKVPPVMPTEPEVLTNELLEKELEKILG